MARGEFRIAKQAGPRGYFGRVSLDVEPVEASGVVQVDFDNNFGQPLAKRSPFWNRLCLRPHPEAKVLPERRAGSRRLH